MSFLRELLDVQQQGRGAFPAQKGIKYVEPLVSELLPFQSVSSTELIHVRQYGTERKEVEVDATTDEGLTHFTGVGVVFVA